MAGTWKESSNLPSDKLIYVWYQDYGNGFIHNQGVPLTREYQIETTITENTGNRKTEDTICVSIAIQKNPDYHCPLGFYGENIDGVTAVVGENGSGKTTLARMLIEYPLGSINEKSPFFWIFVSDDGKIVVYSYKVEISNNENEKIPGRRWEENQVRAVYISNMFNFEELRGSIGLDRTQVGNSLCRQIYTPANLLRYARENARKERYGYRTADNQYLPGIQYYAEGMEPSEVFSYIKKQEELMIECYKTSSPEIRKELGIFEEYEIGMTEFLSDVSYFQSIKNMDADEKTKMLSEVKDVYGKLKNNILKTQNRENIWLNLYVRCLAETYLVLGNTHEELNQWKVVIANAQSLNEEMLSLIEAVFHNVEKAPWAVQMRQCVDMLRQYLGGDMDEEMADCELGTEYFEDSENLIDWYYNELKKPYSFFKRNLSFRCRPGSTGEQMMINLFAYITDAVNENPGGRKFLIIIDEIDAGFHPRWQQSILKYLLDWLNSFKEYRFQIILTSHSPIILSDILKEHVIKLKGKSNGHFEIEAMENPTFGANIAMQFLDSFFMNQGTIGEFSKMKIRSLISEIRDIQKYDRDRMKELWYLVHSIGEDMVRQKLSKDLQRKQMGDEYGDFETQWRLCSREERQQIMEFMENLRNKES